MRRAFTTALVTSAAALCFSLAGCANKPIAFAGSVECLPMATYSPSDQKAAADELDAIKATAPHVVALVIDYGQMREANRACETASNPPH